MLNVGTAHIGEFGSPRGDRAGQGRDRRGAAGRRRRRAQRRRRPGRGDGARAPRARVLTFGRRRAATSRGATSTLDDLGRPSFELGHDGGVGAGAARPGRRAPGRQRGRRRRDGARRGRRPGRRRRRARRGRGRVAAGGWSCTSAPTALVVVNDAYNANPASMTAALDALVAIGARARRRTVAVLGEMLELGDDAATSRTREVGAYAAAAGRRRPGRRWARPRGDRRGLRGVAGLAR